MGANIGIIIKDKSGYTKPKSNNPVKERRELSEAKGAAEWGGKDL